MFYSRRLVLALLFCCALLGLSTSAAQDLTPTPTFSETPTLLPSETPTPTETATVVPTDTTTPSLTPTALPTETPTLLPIPTASETATETSTLLPTDTETPTLLPGESPSPTLTTEASLSPSPSTSPTGTDTATLTLAASATATDAAFAPEPPLSLLFTDTFDTGSLDFWTVGEGWSLTDLPEGPALQAVNSDATTTFVYNSLTNAVVQTQFALHAGMFRLSLRQSEMGAYSVIVAMNGQVALYRNEQVLGTAVINSIEAGSWHSLRLSAIQNVLRLSVDDAEVLVTADAAPLPAGTFSFTGMGNMQSSLLLDNVSLWIPTSELPVTPTPSLTPTMTFEPSLIEAPEPSDFSILSLNPISSNTQILFSATRDGNDSEIYSLDPTTCVPTITCPAIQLTFNRIADSDPALSPDGSKIVFVSNRDGDNELFVMNANGNNIKQLTYNADDVEAPQWSPNGTEIVFMSQRHGNWEIYKLTLANCVSSVDCPVTRLTTNTNYDSHPAWSPDGTKIAYATRSGSNTYILTMNTDGTNLQVLNNVNGTSHHPAWSPDGNWIAFTTSRYPANSGYEVAKLDYGNCSTLPCTVTRLTSNNSGDDDEEPSWSPDGTLIVYSAEYGSTQTHLTLMNADGSDPTRITYSGVNNTGADLGVVNPSYAPIAERLFIDEFETGNFTGWSTEQVDFGDLTVAPSAAILGNYGLRADLDDNKSIYVNDLFTATNRLRLQFFFDPNSITMANGDVHYILTSSTYTFRIELQRAGSDYQLRASINNDTSNGWTNTSWFTISDDAHYIDLAWTASSAPGANNGSLNFWIDSALKQTISGIDNDTRVAAELNLGAVSGVDTGTRGVYYFDEVEIRKLTGSGPFVPIATPTPSLTPTTTLTPTLTTTPTFAYCPAGFAAQSDGVSALSDPENPCIQVTPTLTPTSNCPADFTLADFGIVLEGSWTTEEQTSIIKAACEIGFAFVAQGANSNVIDAFREVMQETEEGESRQIKFTRVPFDTNVCDTSPTPDGIKFTGSIDCHPDTVMNEYTAVHEFGHVFVGRTIKGGKSSYLTFIEIPLGNGPLRDNNNVFIMGRRGYAGLYGLSPNETDWQRSNIETDNGWGSPALWDQSSYYVYEYNTPLPPEPPLDPLYIPKVGPCGEGSPVLPTPNATPFRFQQNPCNFPNWEAIDPVDGPLTELTEGAADMFLNWVYRRNNSSPQSFLDNLWRSSTCYSLIGCPDPRSSGQIRYEWMNTTMTALMDEFHW